MESIGKLVVSVSFDTTELRIQINDLRQLLNSSLECFPDYIVEMILRSLPAVLEDIVLCNNSPATGTGLDIVHSVRFGTKYERLAAAIRARKLSTDTL